MAIDISHLEVDRGVAGTITLVEIDGDPLGEYRVLTRLECDIDRDWWLD